MADDQQRWGYAEVDAYLGISVGAAWSRTSRGTLPAPDDESIPDRPRWRPATVRNLKPLGQGYWSDLLANRPAPSEATV
ncbi:MarR family transcriptional regulator [Kitasatospora sp. NPDC059747]|uniref:MarR family transcriptional regulator n=1 Tax=Kitasatospora sp. NPDC059747 TaxID=3346930 RepID=UPI0036676860